jgi:hypothetical protein
MITWNGDYFYNWVTVFENTDKYGVYRKSEFTTIVPLRVTDQNKSIVSEMNDNKITVYEDIFLALENYSINEKEVNITYALHNDTESELSYHPRYRLDFFSHNEWYWLNADLIYPSDNSGLQAAETVRFTLILKNTGHYSSVTDKPIENEKPKAHYHIIRVIRDASGKNQYHQISLELWFY